MALNTPDTATANDTTIMESQAAQPAPAGGARPGLRIFGSKPIGEQLKA